MIGPGAHPASIAAKPNAAQVKGLTDILLRQPTGQAGEIDVDSRNYITVPLTG
jgi:hypothetical protein